MTASARPRIVVLGGGFAGLESAFLLRSRLGERARLTLVSDQDEFLFKPNTIYIPFGADPRSLLIPLSQPTGKRDIALVRDTVRGIDPDARTVQLERRTLDYDYLVVATGAAMRPEEVPGLAENALTIWTPAEMARLGEALERAVRDAQAGGERTILFNVPPGNKCAGPLYELVLMTETWLRRHGVRDRIRLVWTTFEDTFIQAFGPKLHDVVTEEFAARGIEGHPGLRVSAVEAESVRFAHGPEIAYDVLVAFPPYVAAVDYAPSLPVDERGFVRTGARVRAASRVRSESMRPATPATFPSSRHSSRSSRPTPPQRTSPGRCSARRPARCSTR